MRRLRLRFSLRRMMVAVAIVAASLTLSMSPQTAMTGAELGAGPQMLEVRLVLPSPLGTDGRERLYTKAEWLGLIAKMTSREVVDAALADPKIAKLPQFSSPASKHDALRHCYTVRVGHGKVYFGSQNAYNSALVQMDATGATKDLYRAIVNAILTRGPEGMAILGDEFGYFPSSYQSSRPPASSLFPWRWDAKTLGILAVGLSAILLVLSLPDPKPKSRSEAAILP